MTVRNCGLSLACTRFAIAKATCFSGILANRPGAPESLPPCPASITTVVNPFGPARSPYSLRVLPPPPTQEASASVMQTERGRRKFMKSSHIKRPPPADATIEVISGNPEQACPLRAKPAFEIVRRTSRTIRRRGWRSGSQRQTAGRFEALFSESLRT